MGVDSSGEEAYLISKLSGVQFSGHLPRSFSLYGKALA
jgi:hypothetical protein